MYLKSKDPHVRLKMDLKSKDPHVQPQEALVRMIH